MITRFRFEARAKTKEEVQKELDECVDHAIGAMRNGFGRGRDSWRITDDVISRSGNVYEGRVVYASKLADS